MKSQEVVALPLVSPADEISTHISQGLERVAKRAGVGSVEHLGLVHVAATLANYAVDSCLAPTSRGTFRDCIAELQNFAKGQATTPLQRVRNTALEAIEKASASTLEVIVRSLRPDPRAEPSPIDAHADAVVLRYIQLASYYATSSVVMAIDTATAPRSVLAVPVQVAGALGYRAAALGPARSAELRNRAWQTATWQSELWQTDAFKSLQPLVPQHGARELGLQLLHEFLGASWKTQRDAQYLYVMDFCNWAIAKHA